MTTSIKEGLVVQPREINGVPLYSKSGKVRKRFGEIDRIKMLGGFEMELKAFIKLFAPKLSPHIHRRNGANWFTVHHALRQDDVVKHLLADRIPNVNPIWVGARGWKTTMHAAIDVDFRGDVNDFDLRCKVTEKVLLRLGIPKKRMLVCPTPSGGRHYRIFFRKLVFTDQLPTIFQIAGLPLAPGRFEVFPSEIRGLRLPFGYLPGQTHDPQAWVEFMRAYMRKDFPRINWDQMVKRALSIQQRASAKLSKTTNTSQATPVIQPDGIKLGIPKCLQNQATSQRKWIAAARSEIDPLSMDVKNIACESIHKIWKQGITEPGTRLFLTKALAWHLIFIERLPASEVSERLVEWVYRTGKKTSKDVQADLASGLRKVEQQTREIVNWYESRQQKNGFQPKKYFATQELDYVLTLIKTLPCELQSIRVRFILDFLNFAKKMGRKTERGYECNPSVDGVFRKWENCRNAATYKPHLDWAKEVGLVVLVREKSQQAHRARTYAVVVPFTAYEEWSLSFQEALDYMLEAVAGSGNPSIVIPRHSNDDGYSRIVSLELRENHNQTRDRCGRRVVAISNSPKLTGSKSTGPYNPAVTCTEYKGIDYDNYGKSGAYPSNSRTISCQGTVPAGISEHQYQGGPPRHLARCPSKGIGKGQTVQGLGRRLAGRLPALSQEKIYKPPFPLDKPFRTCPECPGGGVDAGEDECFGIGTVAPGICHRPPGPVQRIKNSRPQLPDL